MKRWLRRFLFGPSWEELTPLQRALATHILNATRAGALK